ncbi:hypothetical protein [Paraburkholderia podalyriae]|uniref:Uncharacterized protein n=1 Tax=Paraburkholderia podalyriae TaxID=1938811 RepID=A0ABR7PHU8_9BURK|nr:hypothetical protein [Paraburkholderia podalyriae]MBC8745886.1 hypothetical protein [Paraburkholderia podalyriae]
MKTILGGSSDENVNANRHTQVVGFSEQKQQRANRKTGATRDNEGEFFVRSCIGCDVPTWRVASLGLEPEVG